MFNKLLVSLGLRAAPTPMRKYLAISSVFVVVPAVAYLAWRYRGKMAPMLRRASQRPSSAEGPAPEGAGPQYQSY